MKKIEKIRDNEDQSVYLEVDPGEMTVNITQLTKKIDEIIDRLNEINSAEED